MFNGTEVTVCFELNVKNMLFYVTSKQHLVSAKVTEGIAVSKKGNATTTYE